LAATGCGLTVHQKMAVQQFSTATTEFASLTRSEFIQSRQDVIEMNRLRILLGDESAKPLDGHFTLNRLQPRLRALEGLNRYGELLQTLLTTSSAADLQTSANDFVSSMNEIHSVQISDSDAEILGKAVVFAGSFLVEHKRARAMKKAVEFAHPYIVKTIGLVESDLDPDNDLWNAGYRHALIDLEGAVIDAPLLATNDLAGAQVVRRAKLVADENKERFDLVSKRIFEAAKDLSRAEGDLRASMAGGEISIADIQEYRQKVNDLKILLELTRSKQTSGSR
jgi:hypothetical protein